MLKKKTKREKENIYQEKMWRLDLLRFVLLVVIFFSISLALMKYSSNDILFGDQGGNKVIVAKKIENHLESTKRVQGNDDFEKVIISENLKYVNEYFPFWFKQGGKIGLGEYDSIKQGFSGDYKDGSNFKVFLARNFDKPYEFRKNDFVLKIFPLDQIEDQQAETENDWLIYSSVWPSSMVIRGFEENGIKEYIILKDNQVQKKFRYQIETQNGSAVQKENGEVVLLDKDGKEVSQLEKIVVYDVLGNQRNNLAKYYLEKSDILELIIDYSGEDYPLLIDPGIRAI